MFVVGGAEDDSVRLYGLGKVGGVGGCSANLSAPKCRKFGCLAVTFFQTIPTCNCTITLFFHYKL